MQLDYRQTPTASALALIGTTAQATGVQVEEALGLDADDVSYVTTTGPGLKKAIVRDVVVKLPKEITLRGAFTAPAASLDTLVRQYVAALSPLAIRDIPGGVATDPVLDYTGSNGTLRRKVGMTRMKMPRKSDVGPTAREFELTFESWEAGWGAATPTTVTLSAGSNSVTVGGELPVYPVFTFGGTSYGPVTVASTTDGGRQVTVSTSFGSSPTTVLVVDMDPEQELVTANGATLLNSLVLGTDRRFRLYPGANTLTVTVTGTPSITVEWYPRWTTPE